MNYNFLDLNIKVCIVEISLSIRYKFLIFQIGTELVYLSM